METNAIIHALDERGNPEIEQSRGQIPITKEDFERVPEIMDAPDNIYLSDEKTKNGLDVIISEKRFDDGTTYYVGEVRTGREKLAFKTMYKKIGQPLMLSDTEESASRWTPETLRNPLSDTTNIQTNSLDYLQTFSISGYTISLVIYIATFLFSAAYKYKSNA